MKRRYVQLELWDLGHYIHIALSVVVLSIVIGMIWFAGSPLSILELLGSLVGLPLLSGVGSLLIIFLLNLLFGRRYIE